MLRLNDTKVELNNISDDDLVSKITHLMWQAAATRNKNRLITEMKSYYDEVQQRGKLHLWRRAKDCFNSNNIR